MLIKSQNKLLTTLLCVLLAMLSIFCVSFYGAEAASETETEEEELIAEGAFIWKLTASGILKISGKGEMPNYALDEVPWADYTELIVKAEIGEGITSVGRCAFYGCSQLQAVSLPSTVTSIGEYAFYSCESLTEITIPSDVSRIGKYAFRRAGLTSATFEKGYGWSAGDVNFSATDLYGLGADLLAKTYYKADWIRDKNAAPEEIDPGFVAGGACNSYTKWELVYIDEAKTQMKLTVSGNGIMPSYGTAGAPWYEYRASIVEIEVETGVTNIGRCAFYGLNNVTKVTLAEGLTSIDDYAFNSCKALTELVIPSTVTSIGTGAFGKTGLSEPPAAEPIQNQSGTVIRGGGFEEGATLVSDEIPTDSEEGAAALKAIADQNYNKNASVYIADIHVIKDGAKVQPDGKVRVYIPIPDENVTEYIVLHLKDDGTVELLTPTVNGGMLTFEVDSFSFFIFIEKASDDTPCAHSYGEWEGADEGNCLVAAMRTRACTLCGKEEVIYVYGDHVYGELIPEVSPTLFEEGVIAYYECSICGSKFNEEKIPVSETVLAKLAPNISICLDGTPVKAFTVDSQTDGQIRLSLSELSVKAGQTVSVCLTDKPDTTYEYTVSEEQWLSIGTVAGNIDPATHKIRATSTSNVELVIGKNSGCALSMDSYVHSGVVIEVTRTFGGVETQLFPMNKVDYYGDPETQAYVFGLMGSDIYTSFRIIDLDTGTVYDYDALSDSNAWDKWSYSRGADGEIVFGILSDWWLAFDIGGDGKITMMRHNLPHHLGTTVTVIDGETTEMEKITLEPGSDEYKYYTWQLTDGAFSRQNEWLERIDLDNLIVYRTILQVEDSASFYIGSDYSIKPWERLSTVYVEDHAIDKYVGSIKEGYYTKPVYGITLEKAGSYVVEYLPFCNVINIYEYIEEEPEVHEHIYVDGKCECGAEDPEYVPDTPAPEGIVIEINGETFAMNFITYPSDAVTSYVYGYVYINAGDKLLIRNTESGAVWGYDDVDPEYGWNTWDYHRGDNGEIVFDFTARYAFEFDYDGCKKIYITKVFALYHGESFGMIFEGDREDVIFDSFDLSASAGAEGEFMWTLTHATTMNSSDFTEYINENGLWFYYAIIDLEEGEKFSLKNFTTDGLIGADYLAAVTGDITALARDGDLVRVVKSGRFHIMYLPAFNSFSIDCDTTDPLSKINLYAGDKALTLIPDENGDIFYEGFESTTYHVISIDDARYSPLPIILDESMDKTLVDLTVSGDYYVAYPTKEGIYNLRYNVYTSVLYLEYVGNNDGGGDEVSGSIDDYLIFLSVIDYTNGNQTLYFTQNPDNPSELYVRVEAMAANSYINVTEMSKSDYSTNSYGTLANTDSSVATNLTAEIIVVKIAGPIDVYYSFETKTVTVATVTDTHEHTYEATVIAPTCVSDGYTSYTCECGDSYVGDTVTATGHAYSDGTCSTCGGADPDYVPDPDGKIIDRIDILGITMPYTGEKPATDDEPYALQEGIEVISVDWGEETYDDATGKIGLIPYGEDFRFENSGDRYYIRARIRLQDGYQLAYEYYDVIATINYVRCWTIQEEGSIIEIFTYLGCNDTTVWYVGVVGIDEPVAGEHPDFDFTCVYDGFHIAEVRWYDTTESDGTPETMKLMTADDVFVEGGFYELVIYVKADEGYRLMGSIYGPELQAFINGMECGVWEIDGVDNTEAVMLIIGY